jgi:hypothetical protein
MNKVVVVIKALYGTYMIKFNTKKNEYNKFLAKTEGHYVILSSKLSSVLKDAEVTLITCPYITKKLYESVE